MTFEHLVVIGASAGGIEATRLIASRLDRGFPAPICVAVHIAASSPDLLASIVGRAGPLPAEFARP
jgi:two-component system chemotaxis response regulator CheB